MAEGCLRYFCIIVLFYSGFRLSSGKLYSTKDPIVLLENDTIAETIYSSPVSWIVEFYSSWCGHCHAFAPTWTKMAHVVKDWRPVFLVAVLDCAEERNLETCKNFQIEAYPTIKFFNANSKKDDLGYKLKGDKTLIHLLHAIVKHVENQTDLDHVSPDFSPASESIISDFQQDEGPRVKLRDQHLALLFEKSFSFIGREIALDMMKYPEISVRRVLDYQTDLVQRFRVSDFPSLILVNRDGSFRELSGSNRTHIGFKKALQSLELDHKQLKWPHEAEVANEVYSRRYENKQTRSRHPQGSSDVYMADLESSLVFTFSREVPMKRQISDQRLYALRNFIHLLYKCFPGRQRIMRFLKDTLKKLSLRQHGPRVHSLKVITSDEFMNWVLDHKKPGKSQLPSKIFWRGCLGSKSKYRGYSCGLWTLFHTLTVTCSKLRPGDLSGKQVLVYIREYIRNFFSCEKCGKHFSAMAANIEDEVVTHRDAVLWLWHGHNLVNNRLRGDESEDPKHPKIQYPPVELCRECHTEDSGWNEEVLYRFLQSHYGLDNIRVETEVLQDMLTGFEAADKVRKNGSSLRSSMASLIGLNRYDTSLCLVIYSVITFGFIALYVYFIRRRRLNYRYGYGYKHHVHTP